jgi:alpha-L-fucosidase
MNRSWGYRITDNNYKSVDFLVKYLIQTSAKGANLLLNIGPRPDGTLPQEALERLEAMGKWLDLYGETIYGTTAGIVPEQPWGVSTRKGNRHFIHIFNLDEETIFIPIQNTKITDCKEYLSGKPIEFKKFKGSEDSKPAASGITIETSQLRQFLPDSASEEATDKASEAEAKVITIEFSYKK